MPIGLRSRRDDIPIDVTSAPVHRDVCLDVVLDALTTTPQMWATIIDDDRRVVGTIALSDIVRSYRRTTLATPYGDGWGDGRH